MSQLPTESQLQNVSAGVPRPRTPRRTGSPLTVMHRALPLSLCSLCQAFTEQRVSFEADMTREMLDQAKAKCFDRCFAGPHGAGQDRPAATTIAASTTNTQQACMTNCLDKYLDARTIIFRKTMKQPPRA